MLGPESIVEVSTMGVHDTTPARSSGEIKSKSTMEHPHASRDGRL